jgi:nucleotide-binding universal stress UspA family protein
MSASVAVADGNRPVTSTVMNTADAVYSTVLVATDGSVRAQIAVERAAALAANLHATLITVSVVQAPVVSVSIGALGVDALTALAHQRRQTADRAVRAAAATAGSYGVVTTPVVRSGDPAQQTIAVADEINAGVIVVGDCGLDPAGHYVLSSVPAALALHARHHDLLVVRTTPP